MYFVYVLYSRTTNRHYIGFTTHITQRIGQHNSGITKSTKGRGPWVLVHQEEGSRGIKANHRRAWRACRSWIESACGGNQKVGGSTPLRRAIFPNVLRLRPLQQHN